MPPSFYNNACVPSTFLILPILEAREKMKNQDLFEEMRKTKFPDF
jgi:hypothetical protein